MNNMREYDQNSYSEGEEDGEDAVLAKPDIFVEDTTHAYEVVAEMPGVDENRVNLNVDGDKLRIRADLAEANLNKSSAKRIGAYGDTIAFDTQVDKENMDTEMNNGVLRVTLPKVNG